MIRERVHSRLEPVTLGGLGWLGPLGGAVQPHFAAPLAAAESHEGDSSGYPLQPPAETAALLVAPQRLREPDEHVMHDVLCILAGANQPIGEPKQGHPVLQVESGEGVWASSPRLSDQGR